MPADKPQPVIVKVHDRSFFPDNMAPVEGCAFWIVEHPANEFLFQIRKGPRLFPKTLRELAAAIVSCTMTPEDYLQMWEDTKTKAREHAQTLQDKPEEQKRYLRIAEAKLPEGDAGKHVCRVVYVYPNQKGTMTTSIRMDQSDLEQLRALLQK